MQQVRALLPSQLSDEQPRNEELLSAVKLVIAFGSTYERRKARQGHGSDTPVMAGSTSSGHLHTLPHELLASCRRVHQIAVGRLADEVQHCLHSRCTCSEQCPSHEGNRPGVSQTCLAPACTGRIPAYAALRPSHLCRLRVPISCSELAQVLHDIRAGDLRQGCIHGFGYGQAPVSVVWQDVKMAFNDSSKDVQELMACAQNKTGFCH